MSALSHLDYARKLLTEGVDHQKADRYAEALVCYKQGIEALIRETEQEKDAGRRARLTERINDYLKQAEAIQDKLKQEAKLQPPGETQRRHQKSISIADGATGFSYATVFDPYMRTAKQVTIRDPYIRRPHQVHNLVRFCELCYKRELKTITLVTGLEDGDANAQEQLARLNELKADLKRHNIAFSFSFDQTLHDRDVSFDNGWVIRLGRGLDYFKRLEGTFALGYHDFDLRPCQPVNVDIWQEIR